MVAFIWIGVDSVGAPRGCRIHSGSGGFIRARLVVVEIIRVRVASLVRLKGSSGSYGFV